MNKNEMAQVMLSDGPWEYRPKQSNGEWYRCSDSPAWDWWTYDYRVKPKPAELFVNEYPGGGRVAYRTPAQAERAFSKGQGGNPSVRYIRASDVGIS